MVLGCGTDDLIAEAVQLVGVRGQGLSAGRVVRHKAELRVRLDGCPNGGQFLALGLVAIVGAVITDDGVAQEQVWRSGAGGNSAIVLPGHAQFTQHTRILPGLGHAHFVAVGIGHFGGVGAGGTQAVGVKVAKQGVGISADNDIHSRQALGQCQIVGILVVGQQDDLVDALVVQLIDHGLGGFGFVQKLSACQRA